MSDTLDLRSIATSQLLALDVVQTHGHGHAGAPVGLAPLAHVLFQEVLRHDPATPTWEARDRFVLSAGHASLLLYTQLYLSGYGLRLDDIKATRSFGSLTPGHPEYGHTPGVEMTTGPLGQGVASAVGMAMGLGRLHDVAGVSPYDQSQVWCLASDGDLMEGVSAEASSLAGTLGVDRLVVMWDDNGVTIDGTTDLAFGEDVRARYRAYGWQVLDIEDVTDLDEVRQVLAKARASTGTPVLVAVRSVIGGPVREIAGTPAAHAGAYGEDAVAATKERLGFDPGASFVVDDDVLAHTRRALVRGRRLRESWEDELRQWRAEHPAAARRLDGLRAPVDVSACDLVGDELAPVTPTRKASGAALGRAHELVPALWGGSADLRGSTGLPDQADLPFGIREHAMAAVLNGIALHGWFRPYGSTYLTFTDYARPALRLSALMGLPVVHVYTHDSVAVGEDGPTHQPVEQLWALRLIPDLDVVRPADAREVAGAWSRILSDASGPTAMVLSRQDVALTPGSSAELAARGGYVVRDVEDPDLIIIATGSEVPVAAGAAELLDDEGIRVRVVSLPCMEWFAQQPQDYRDSVLPPSVRARVSVEAGVEGGWRRWVGDAGEVVSVDRFGLSGDGARVMTELGISIEATVEAARRSLARCASTA